MCITESPETKSKVLANYTVNQLWFLFSHCCVWLFVTPWIAACQARLSFTVSRSLLKFMSLESETVSNYLILCRPFSFCLQPFPALGFFPKSQFFTSDGQSTTPIQNKNYLRKKEPTRAQDTHVQSLYPSLSPGSFFLLPEVVSC